MPTRIWFKWHRLLLILLVLSLTSCLTTFYMSVKKKYVMPSTADSVGEMLRKFPTREEWKPRKVVLFTYARSGSSMLGNIIDHSAEVYYMFEPLIEILNIHTKRPEWNVSHSFDDDDFIDDANVLMNGLENCNFTLPAVDKVIGKISDFLGRVSDTSYLQYCNKFITNKTTELRRTCLQHAARVCSHHNITLIKVIRYSTKAAEKLMTLNPDLAILYLVRDPRASMWSRMTVFGHPKEDLLSSFARDLCHRMYNDLKGAITLFNRSPAKIRFLRYEELADNPIRVSKEIYHFLQLQWTQDVETRIKDQVTDQSRASNIPTIGRQSDGEHKLRFSPYSVKRTNSSVAANVWRNRVPWNVVDTVQKSCSYVMSFAGYKKFSGLEAVRNWSVSSRGRFTLVDELIVPEGDLGQTVYKF